MPYKQVYVKPEVFLKYKGVTVYFTYEMGEIQDPSYNYVTTDIEATDDDDKGTQFDVRNLPTYKATHPKKFLTRDPEGDMSQKNKRAWQAWNNKGGSELDNINALKRAIDSKILTKEGLVKKG